MCVNKKCCFILHCFPNYAATYQNISKLKYVVNSYINSLSRFNGADWGGVRITPADAANSVRELRLIIPAGGTEAQLSALEEMRMIANNPDIILRIVVHP